MPRGAVLRLRHRRLRTLSIGVAGDSSRGRREPHGVADRGSTRRSTAPSRTGANRIETAPGRRDKPTLVAEYAPPVPAGVTRRPCGQGVDFSDKMRLADRGPSRSFPEPLPPPSPLPSPAAPRVTTRQTSPATAAGWADRPRTLLRRVDRGSGARGRPGPWRGERCRTASSICATSIRPSCRTSATQVPTTSVGAPPRRLRSARMQSCAGDGRHGAGAGAEGPSPPPTSALKVYDCYPAPTRAVRDHGHLGKRWQERAARPSGSIRSCRRTRCSARATSPCARRTRPGPAIDLTLVWTCRPGAQVAKFDPAAAYGPCTGPVEERSPDNSLDNGQPATTASM